MMASLNDHENRIKRIEDSIMKTYSYTKTISVVSGQWTSTGIKLPETGTYIINMFANTYANGGVHYSETYSGICSFFSENTNDDHIIEIPLTNSGHAPNGKFYCLAFKHVGNNTGKQEIVITSNENTKDCQYKFNFRRVL